MNTKRLQRGERKRKIVTWNLKNEKFFFYNDLRWGKFFAIVQAIGLKKREKLPPNSIGKSVCALIQTWGYSYHPWMDNNSRYCFSMYLCKQVKWDPFQSCLFIFTHWIPIESVIKTKKQTNNKCENRPWGTFLSWQWLLELDPKNNFQKIWH